MHVIGTAGHVDHGKSSLVHRLTGIDPDRFEEEKRRGLTIDLGFAWLELPSGREIGLVDVPGHERFIKNMLAGAGGINVCLFVVAANEGWMPQSAEHLAILDVLGVSHGVVALTKSDTVTPEELSLVRAETEERLSASSLAGAPVVACSAVSGEGLDELLAALDRVLADTPPASDVGRARLWVDRVFTIAGAGTVVTGTLAGGSFEEGQEVEISPEGRRARIRTIQSHKKRVSSIPPGHRVALNLAGLERQGAERGDAIVHAGRWRSASLIDAWIQVADAALAGKHYTLHEKGAHLLYVGSAETPVRIRLLDADELRAGQSGFAQLHLRDPLPLARGDRFVLRDAGRVFTFGGGEVLDPLASHARKRDEGRLELLERLRGADSGKALLALVEAAGTLPLREAELRSGHVGAVDGVRTLGDVLVSQARFAELHRELTERLAAYHRAHPLERGMAREALRSEVGLEPGVFDALLTQLPEFVAEGSLVRAREHEVSLDPSQAAARSKLLEEIDAGGFNPPLAKELRAEPTLVKALVDGGELVRIGDFFLTRARAVEARAKVRSRIEAEGPITVAQIRDLLGTSRKYAVPLCEWLDATGATRRQGDVRTLGPKP